jgi:hypothetical protein
MSFVVPLVALAAIAAVVFGLLKDHVGAWVLFGVFVFGGRASVALLEQPAGADFVSGAVGLVLVVLAAGAFLAGRRALPETAPTPLPPEGQ